MKKTVLLLSLVFLLCALFVKPDCLPQMIRSAETARVTKANAEWKTTAENSGADVRAFDNDLFYTETPAENMVKVGNVFAYANNELIVFFKDGTSLREKQSVFDSLNAKVIGCISVIHKYQLQLPQAKTFSALQAQCASLQTNRHVELACCNIALQMTEDAVPDDPWLEPDGYPAAATWSESDVRGGNWWLTATQMPSAWDYQAYFQPIRVGIVDSGFCTEHEDLQNKITFPHAFFRSTNRPNSHGTHVAGIIGATANNQIGVTGICDNAELMCVDWEPEEGEQKWYTSERIFTGIVALVLNGAKVINMSLGSSHAFEQEKQFRWKLASNMEGIMYSYMIASLLRIGYDFIVVQSAGNGDANRDPCDSFYNGGFCAITKKNAFTGLTGISKQEILDHLIVVGSSTSAHDKTTFYQSVFSNYGDGVSIFAPGSSIFSTDLPEKGGYSYKSGTSMAAPVVTGIAAMTWSVNPKLTGQQVKKILCDPQNSVYTVENHYNETMDIPTYRMINGKLCVQAAIRTLPESERLTEPVITETETEPDSIPFHPTVPFTILQANEEEPLLNDRSDDAYIEQFRTEVGE